MARPKKQKGRPARRLPPRTDATVDELVEAFFKGTPDTVITEPKEYRCVDCRKEVYYPEILYRDGRCEGCHKAPVG